MIGQEKINTRYRRFLNLIGISSGCIVMGLVFTMINTAIPAIQKSMGISIHQMQWMMMSFGIVNCAFLVISGRIADVFGRKKFFLIGLCSSGIGMIWGGLSQGSAGLILSMSLAGLGNSILLPVSQAMLVSEFPESQKSYAIAIWASAIAYAMAMGPLVGGMISEVFGWRWVFWSMVPLFVMSSLLISFFARENKNTVDPPQIDYKGMGLIGLGLSSFVVLAAEFKNLSMTTNGLLLGVTIFTFLILWKHCRTFPSPILLPELIRKKRFLAASIASGCLIFYLWSAFFLFPIYLHNVCQLSSLNTGFIMLGITVPMIFLSPIIGKKYQPHRAWIFIFLGFLFLSLSSILQGFFHENISQPFIQITILLLGIGYGLICGPTATAAVSIVPAYKAGIASGTFVTFQEIGGTLGLAVVVTAFRLNPDLTAGMQRGAYSFLLVSILGCFCGLLLKPSKVNSKK